MLTPQQEQDSADIREFWSNRQKPKYEAGALARPGSFLWNLGSQVMEESINETVDDLAYKYHWYRYTKALENRVKELEMENKALKEAGLTNE